MSNQGYSHRLYAESLSEFGELLELPASKGWILKRSISGTSLRDGMGCYPIFSCEDWSRLGQDLGSVSSQLVSLSMVTDPFGGYTYSDLLQSFRDLVFPYKEHFIVDLRQPPDRFVAAHHQRNAQKALKRIRVEVETDPLRYLDEWTSLYNHLIERHQITGISRFSREAFALQLQTPGIVAFRAILNGQTAGMVLWYVQGDIGYYHLGAYSPDGYRSNASFALFWTLLEYFSSQGLLWLSLGAGAGAQGSENDGLTRFKRGWSTGTRTAYFCGRIFDLRNYQQILSLRNIDNSNYFPAYRAGEFA